MKSKYKTKVALHFSQKVVYVSAYAKLERWKGETARGRNRIKIVHVYKDTLLHSLLYYQTDQSENFARQWRTTALANCGLQTL